MNDTRPDELLEQTARAAWRHRLALAWSDGLTGEAAKACTRSGSAAWKNAKPLSENETTAVAHFVTRARTRNPAVPAAANELVIVESDLDVPDGAYPPLEEVTLRVSGLLGRLGLRLPRSVVVRSRRGLHVYLRPDVGCAPAKVQLSERGDEVVYSSDGYVIGVPGLHELEGVVYEYVHDGEIATLPAETHARIVELGDQAHERMHRAVEAGEPITEPGRRDAIFHMALSELRNGTANADVIEHALAMNRAQCRPVLDERRVHEQVKGAAIYAGRHPTESERAREHARRVLNGKAAPTPKPSRRPSRELGRRPIVRVPIERVELLPGTPLPVGTLSLAAGVGGLGKSALALAYAKQVTDAGGAVLVISYEDAAGAVIRPRFEALGGDLNRLYVLEVASHDGEISFPSDLPELERHIRETEARLVIVDPVSASIDLKLDAHRDQDVRVVLGQLARVAERERLAALQVAHLNKSPGADPYLRINASTAFYNASRLVLTVTPDPLDLDWQRIVAAHKANYGAVPPPERWRIVIRTIPSPIGLIDAMTLRFVEVAEDVSREEVLAASTPGKHTQAAVLILETLAEGRQLSARVKAAGVAQGLSDRTIKRAAAELDVVVEEETTATGRVTYWSLPGGVGPTPSPETWPDPSSPLEQDNPEGSGQIGVDGERPDPQRLECSRHEGLHKVTSRAAGLVYLACGCFLREDDA